MIELSQEKIIERFRSYVSLDTASDDKAETSPSTAKQLELAQLLRQELTALGLQEVELTEYGYVLATLPSNSEEERPVIGLIAHMDTSNEASGANVKMQVQPAYDGGDIMLSPGITLSPQDFPELKNYVGQEIITSDGTTLLGADDKAGICAIVSACEYLLRHPEIRHGKVRLAFTPDEEVGRGTEHFPLQSFGADFAYTVDGGAIGELNYETFNACNATITFYGVSVHPGSAKNKMRNAVTMAAKWQMLLPAGERPEYTEMYEGFYHSLRISGGTDKVELEMILRDHNRQKLEARKALLLKMTDYMNAEYGAGSVVCQLEDVYCNMKEYIMPVYEIIERAENAMHAAGVEPQLTPVRGGTDGARLSEMGLPCPNIFTGGHNFHGRFEYLPVPSLLKCVEVLVKLVQK
ncbi:MAG: peptidase T [Phascolarctobacterium sp.]|uniref:peptidase T n=1 Tax=Phascolarctobacterium sp. TaxID=2049039 RepID=UPI0025F9C68A|nr:peptidase T [Phascolarctobacterium sp.]MCC8159251.1 peptidase T [Phascolarctobacterium sp.]